MKSCIPLLGGSIYIGATLEQLTHNIHMPLLAGQVQCIQPILEKYTY